MQAEPTPLTSKQWVVTFLQPTILKEFINIANYLLKDCSFTIHAPNSSRPGLSINCMDERHISLVQAHLNCKVALHQEAPQTPQFVINLKILQVWLKKINGDYIIEISQRTDDDSKILIEAYNPQTGQHRTWIELSLLDDISKPPQLDNITYDFTVEIDLSTFKSIISTAKDLTIDAISIKLDKVAQPPRKRQRTEEDTEEDDFYITISAGNSLAKFAHVLHSKQHKSQMLIEDEEGTHTHIVITAAQTELADIPEDMEELVNEDFSVEYLDKFLRGLIDREALRVSISHHAPMVIQYTISEGNPTLKATAAANPSHFRFVLVPKASDVG